MHLMSVRPRGSFYMQQQKQQQQTRRIRSSNASGVLIIIVATTAAILLFLGRSDAAFAGYNSFSSAPFQVRKPVSSFRRGIDQRSIFGAAISSSSSSLHMLNNNYLSSLNNQEEDSNDNGGEKSSTTSKTNTGTAATTTTTAAEGGLASFQSSGSYLEHLAAASSGKKDAHGGGGPTTTTTPSKPTPWNKNGVWSPSKTAAAAASSYLNALKPTASSSSSQVSPWDAAKTKSSASPPQPSSLSSSFATTSRPAPWKPLASQPKFAPVQAPPPPPLSPPPPVDVTSKAVEPLPPPPPPMMPPQPPKESPPTVSSSSSSPWSSSSESSSSSVGTSPPRPAPWTPMTASPQSSSSSSSNSDAAATARPAPWTPNAAARPAPWTPLKAAPPPVSGPQSDAFAASSNSNDETIRPSVEPPPPQEPLAKEPHAVFQDMLDSSTRGGGGYENLTGDITEDEGFIVAAPVVPIEVLPKAASRAIAQPTASYFDTMEEEEYDNDEYNWTDETNENTSATLEDMNRDAIIAAEATRANEPDSFFTSRREPMRIQQATVEETFKATPPPAATADTNSDDEEEDYIDDAALIDEHYMRMALSLASTDGGERSARSAYPNPNVGAILVAHDGTILGNGFSDYNSNAIVSVFESAGLDVIPADKVWIVSWPDSKEGQLLQRVLASATLYVTLEPSTERRGTTSPPITQLIQQVGVPRVVIGSPDPIPERQATGAAALQEAGIDVSFGAVLMEECNELIRDYAEIANGKFQKMARKHYELSGRPLGFLHCSVIDSDNVEAFARQGNAFGKSFGGNTLSYRDFGSYELAPPPDVIWANEEISYEEEEDATFSVDFEDEEGQSDMLGGSPVMPWYEQADAVVATFPRQGNGPPDDDSVAGRLTGLKWLATHGCSLPAGVERILVLDASDLKDLPLRNGDPNLPPNFDIEAFWAGKNRKPTRVILRRGQNEAAQAAAKAAAAAAQRSAEAAAMAATCLESGDASKGADAAIECLKSAESCAEFVFNELRASLELRRILESLGVVVDSIEGGEPIEVMKHLGESGLHSVVWRAGCWGERGVKAILAGAFQWVSAHLTVHTDGGKFWQLMMAENAVQAACGPRSKVKVFSDQEDMNLEYCDEGVEEDCVLTIDGRPVRHVRLDCRVALVEEGRGREFSIAKTQKINRKILLEEAPWFL